MPDTRSTSPVPDRLMFCLLGAGAGTGLWLLGENWNHPGWPGGLFLAAFTFVAVFSAGVLALLGPVSVLRALAGGFGLAVPVTGLVSLAGRRYADPMQLLDQTPALVLTWLLVFVAIPFLILALGRSGQWRRYDLLFGAAWTVTARYLLAWVFVAVFWALVFLSDALMSLIGVDLIERLLDTKWLVFATTGAVLGLGLSVVYELRATLSPFLFLRMLRLLVPLVLAVVALFLAALPLRGLSDLFGGVSSAGTLMGVCIAGIALVSIAVDRDEENEVATRGLRFATQALALTLPALAGLALWSVALRVGQYGWTPDRVLGAGVAGLLGFYSLGHGLSVVFSFGSGNWAERIRQVNFVMALGLMGFCAAWLTPVLDANRLSTGSQIARFSDGRAGAADLAWWAMQHDWGRSGQAGLAQLEAMTGHPEADLVRDTLRVVRQQPDRYRFEQALTDSRAPEELARLVALMPVVPAGQGLSVADLDGLPDYRRSEWLQACGRDLPGGGPGCVMIRGRFLPVGGAQAIVLHRDESGSVRAHHLWVDERDGVQVRDVYGPGTRDWPDLPADAIRAAQTGQFQLKPRDGQALHIGGQVLEALP